MALFGLFRMRFWIRLCVNFCLLRVCLSGCVGWFARVRYVAGQNRQVRIERGALSRRVSTRANEIVLKRISPFSAFNSCLDKHQTNIKKKKKKKKHICNVRSIDVVIGRTRAAAFDAARGCGKHAPALHILGILSDGKGTARSVRSALQCAHVCTSRNRFVASQCTRRWSISTHS